MSFKNITSNIESSWKTTLNSEINAPYFINLLAFLTVQEKQKTIFPPPNEVFSIYNSIPLSKVKVVILGQDPYHGDGQAHGLSFSVKKGVRQPPSLVNIFKELDADFGIPSLDKFNGNLTTWAQQGVFLLNAVLTVEKADPNSHKNKGWEQFTDATISAISKNKEHVVFVLWGNYAKQKASLIDENKHLILSSVHPSPFSARNGFFGSKPFSKINTYLEKHNLSTINWNID